MEDSHDTLSKAEELFRFSVKRAFVAILKSSITLLEDLREDHKIFRDKLWRGAKLEDCDYFTEAKFQQLRKRILDNNDILRDLEKQLENYEIRFK